MLRIAVIVLLGTYPLLVWFGLARWGAPTLLGTLLVLLGVRAIAGTSPARRVPASVFGTAMSAAGIVVVLTDTGSEAALRWYPVIVSLLVSGLFAASLFSGRPLIERFARLRQADLPEEALAYTRRLTVIWATLTFANALAAAATAMFADIEIWALYNGFLSYLLLGSFFCAEWLYRQHRFAGA